MSRGPIHRVSRIKSWLGPVDTIGMTGNSRPAQRKRTSGRWDFGIRELSDDSECPECAPADPESASASADLACEGCGRPRPESGNAWTLTAALDALWAGKGPALGVDMRRL